MDIIELNQRLDTLINEFDDNIVEVSHFIFVEPLSLFTSSLDRERMRFTGGRLEKEAKTSILSYKKFEEWKELFNVYKKLINDPNAKEFVDNFYKSTEEKHFYLFNPIYDNNPRERKEWRELHEK